MVTEDVAPGGVGKAELRGASWTARTAGRSSRGRPSLPGGARRRSDAVAEARVRSRGNHDGRRVVVFVLALFVVLSSRGPRSSSRSRAPTWSSGSARYAGTLDAGFHILVPFIDVIRYRHSLKEQAIDIPAQVCITRDNVQVGGGRHPLPEGPEPRARLLRHHRTTSSPSRSSPRRRCAARSARSTSTAPSRSAPTSTSQVVSELDKASEPWGVKVLRYEIKNITPPQDVLAAMEKQMRAEREKRAVILTSEGQRDAAINTAEGAEAAGDQGLGGHQAAADQRGRRARPPAILAVATATAEGIRRSPRRSSARADSRPCSCASPSSTSRSSASWPRPGNTLILPANLADVGSMIATAMNVIQSRPGPARPPRRAEAVPPRRRRCSRRGSARSSRGCGRRRRAALAARAALQLGDARRDAALVSQRRAPGDRPTASRPRSPRPDPRAARLPAAAAELRVPGRPRPRALRLPRARALGHGRALPRPGAPRPQARLWQPPRSSRQLRRCLRGPERARHGYAVADLASSAATTGGSPRATSGRSRSGCSTTRTGPLPMPGAPLPARHSRATSVSGRASRTSACGPPTSTGEQAWM